MRIGAWRRKRCAEPLCRRGLPCGAAVPPCGSPRALPRGSPHGICPCVAPPFLCGSVCAAALFHAGGGIALRGACPLHPRAEPGRHLQPQQKRYPAGGGLPCLPPADHAFPEAAGGLGGFGRLPALPLALFFAPIPPTPFPGGEGGALFSLFRRGRSPRRPGIRPPAALARPAAVVLNGGACPCAALAIPAPGERTISNAAVACDG